MITERVWFESEGLSIEGLLSYAETTQAPRAKVLLCPPHPFLGGDMHNNVISHLSSALAQQDYLVLCFNYRGIGASESNRSLEADQLAFWDNSTCPDYEAEMHTDCRSALAWLRRQLDPRLPVLAVGYSFGCLPALDMTRSEEAVTACALISPPLNKWPIPAEQVQFQKPKGLFYSPGDFACDADRLRALFEAMAAPRELSEIEDADHFFINKEPLLGERLSGFLAGL